MKKLLTSIFATVLFCGIFASSSVNAEILPSYIPATKDGPLGKYMELLVTNTMQHIAGSLETMSQEAQTKQLVRYFEADCCIALATAYICLPDEYMNNSRIQKAYDTFLKDTIKTFEWALKKAGSSATFDSVIQIADAKFTKIVKDFDKTIGETISNAVETNLSAIDLSDRAVRLLIYLNAASYAQKFHPNKDELITILANADNL